MAVILVGAIFVGSMDTLWSGQVTPARGRSASRSYGDEDGIELKQGEEMGRFNMGSTVILLFPPDAVTWDKTLKAGDVVQMGQRLGSFPTIEQPENVDR
jgi:phosphatidylserine decarboxylase